MTVAVADAEERPGGIRPFVDPSGCLYPSSERGLCVLSHIAVGINGFEVEAC